MKIPKFCGIHARPAGILKITLSVLPFVLVVSIYLVVSHNRIARNPDEKLTPSVGQMVKAAKSAVMSENKRTHERESILLKDTAASLKRIMTGLVLASYGGLIVGLNTGIFPGLSVIFMPILTFLSIIPPLAVLPILFLTFGADELGKIMLIFLGNFFVISTYLYQNTVKIPKEEITKALTLGASQWKIVYRVIMPQMMPVLIETVKGVIGQAWLFLIAAEAIAATEGLGYRIFLARRFQNMDLIIPYVLWITFMGFLMSFALRKYLEWRYKWYVALARGGQ